MFLTTILTFFYNVLKNFPFLHRQKLACMALKLTREVSISSLAKNIFNYHSLLPLQCFQNFPFLNHQNSGLFGTQIYTRGIDFLLSKKCF